MPFTNLNLITITGKFLLLNGSNAAGSVSFAADQTLIDSVANEIVVPVEITANLVAGVLSVALPATDDPDLAPAGWTYTVTETIANARTKRVYQIQVPYDAPGATLDLADIVPVAVVDPVSPYILTNRFLTHVDGSSDRHAAAGVDFVPGGGLLAATVQAAIEELDAEKALTSHDHNGTYVDTTTDQAALGVKQFAEFHVGSGRPWVDPRHKQGTGYGAVGDGVSRPLSGLYGSLAAAQAAFPGVTSLDEELDSAATRRALAISNKVRFDDGVFVFNRTVDHTTSGNVPGAVIECAGMDETVIDARVANGPAFSFDGSGTAGAFAYGAKLGGLTILTEAAAAGTRGVDIRAQWFMELDQLRIKELPSDGVRVRNDGVGTSGDPDSTSHLVAGLLQVENCGGIGWNVLNQPVPGTPSASNTWTFMGCDFRMNEGGGMRLLGLHHTLINCNFSSNGSYGLQVPYTDGAAARHLSIIQGEFDGNESYHIDLRNVSQVDIRQAKFIFTDNPPGSLPAGGHPATAVLAGDGADGIARNVRITQCTVRNDLEIVKTGFRFGSNAIGCRYEGTSWESSSEFLVKHSDASPDLTYEDAGFEVVRTKASTTAESGLRIPHGEAPTSSLPGDLWSTTSGLFFNRNNNPVRTVALLEELLAALNTWTATQTFTDFVQMQEVAEPGNSGADRGRLFLMDNGAGKTQLCVRFQSGVTQVIATEP